MHFTAIEIEKYERGDLSFEKTVDLFQRIVDSGMLWRFDNGIHVDINELIDRGYVLARY
tara:strand:+ start:522 stop:698 length:177 start_codon:yes stop_codon:yes gene_type:complete